MKDVKIGWFNRKKSFINFKTILTFTFLLFICLTLSYPQLEPQPENEIGLGPTPTEREAKNVTYTNNKFLIGNINITPSILQKDGKKLNYTNYFEERIIKINSTTFQFGIINVTGIPSVISTSINKFIYTLSGENLEQQDDSLIFTKTIEKECPINQFGCNEIEIYDFRDIIEKTNSKEYNITKSDNSYIIEFTGFTSYDFDPKVTFSTSSVEGVCGAPLDDDEFVIGWCDETADDILAQVFYTNGTSKNGVISVNSNVDNCSTYNVYNSNYINNIVSCFSFNNSVFGIAYYDADDEDITFKTYYSNGSGLSSTTDVTPTAGYDYLAGGVSTTVINYTTFIISYFDAVNSKVYMSLYDYAGNDLTATDVAIGSAGYYSAANDIDMFNSTHFGFLESYYNGAATQGTNYYLCSTSGACTSLQLYFIDASHGNIKVINRSVAILGYEEDIGSNDKAPSFKIIYANGTTINYTRLVNSDLLEVDVPIGRINISTFVAGFWEDAADDVSFQTFESTDINAINLTGVIDTSTTALPYSDIVSSNYLINTSICSGTFVHIYVVSTLIANFTTYYYNGTLWDGNCSSSEEAPANDCTCPASGDFEIDDGSDCELSTTCGITGNFRIISGNMTILPSGVLRAYGGCFVADISSLFVDNSGGFFCGPS